MSTNEGRVDEVFAARVGLGLRELDGIERAPDVSAEVLRRLREGERVPHRSAFSRLALAAALLAIAVTTTLVVMQRGLDGAGPGVAATQDPGAQDPAGAWRLVYEPVVDASAPREADVERLLTSTVEGLQKRLGTAVVVARGEGRTLAVTLAQTNASEVATVRERIEKPGELTFHAVADEEYATDGVRFDLAGERRRLQAWLDAGGRDRLRGDLRAIAEYRPASQHLRWVVHVVRPEPVQPGFWQIRYVDLPSLAASAVAAHAESEWNGGAVPAAVLAGPVEQRVLIELLAVNMHERSFHGRDVDPASVAQTDVADEGPAVNYRWRPGQAADFAAFSEKYVGKHFAVLWNDEVLITPRFAGKITGAGAVRGLSAAQADAIAKVLSAPVPLRLRLVRSEPVRAR